MEPTQAKHEVLEACKELVARGLVARTWGNISCRIDENRFVITPSGIGYERLGPDSLVEVDVHTLEHKGDIKPSSEKGIHAAAYRLNANTHFVIHTHQSYATCLSVAGFSAIAPSAEETQILGGAVTRAEYGLPGTKRLKNNVESCLAKGSAAVLMEKHGALLTGPSREAAFARAVLLEDVCRRAAGDIPAPGGAFGAGSRRLDEAAFLFRAAGEAGEGRRLPLNGANLAGEEALHAALYARYPAFRAILQLSSPVLAAVMSGPPRLPAILDDFAQIVGGDAKICAPPKNPEAVEAAARAMAGRNAALVKGLGAVACAAEAGDCEAVLSLVEKNALAWLNARQHGKPPALPWIDKKLMRHVYLTKYSKQK